VLFHLNISNREFYYFLFEAQKEKNGIKGVLMNFYFYYFGKKCQSKGKKNSLGGVKE